MPKLELVARPGTAEAGEEELIEASRQGDAEAFARLYSHYRLALYATCLRRLRDPALAEDVVQDTFLRAFTNLARFDAGRRLWPWLLAIAERRCIDVLRRASRTSLVDDVEESQTCAAALNEAGTDVTLDAVICAEERGRLEAALGQLPSRQRRALLLFALEGWNYSDIASAEHASISSVKSLIFRARRTLRAACETGVLGAVLIPVRRLRHRMQRIAQRIQAGGEGLVGGAMQSISTTALALSLALAGFPAANSGILPSRLGGGAVAPAPLVRNSALGVPAHGSSLRAAAHPISVDETAAAVGKQVLDPTKDATPENTQFTGFAASPAYAQDHTLFAAGTVPCARQLCRVLFASYDGGATWKRLPAASFSGESLLVPPGAVRGSTIYAMGSSGLQESVDRGVTFHLASPLVGGIAASPRFGSGDPRILIGAAAVVEYWADKGLTRPAALTAVSEPYSTIAFSPAYPAQDVTLLGAVRPGAGRLLESVVYRCAGSVCAGVPLSGAVGVPALRLSPGFARDSVGYAFTSDAVFISRDSGGSFAPLVLPRGVAGFVRDLAVLSDCEIVMAVQRGSVSGAGGIYVSRTCGASWTRSDVRVPGFSKGATRVIVAPTGRLWAGGLEAGLACSEDGGRRWSTRCSAAR
jgi:RNA polymerase sigma-70 factor (ECF subfamily)